MSVFELAKRTASMFSAMNGGDGYKYTATTKVKNWFLGVLTGILFIVGGASATESQATRCKTEAGYMGQYLFRGVACVALLFVAFLFSSCAKIVLSEEYKNKTFPANEYEQIIGSVQIDGGIEDEHDGLLADEADGNINKDPNYRKQSPRVYGLGATYRFLAKEGERHKDEVKLDMLLVEASRRYQSFTNIDIRNAKEKQVYLYQYRKEAKCLDSRKEDGSTYKKCFHNIFGYKRQIYYVADVVVIK